jgi:hypothetical protein
MDCVVGGLDPGELAPVAADVSGGLQGELQVLVAQPQPGPPRGPALGEPGEYRADGPGDRLVGMEQDLTVGLAPDQSDGQAAAQLTAGGLAADPAVQACSQHVQLGLGHGSLQAQQHPVVEQSWMVDAVGVGDQGVGHARQVQ